MAKNKCAVFFAACGSTNKLTINLIEMNIDLTEKWAKEIALMTDEEFAENCKYIEMLINKRKTVLPQAAVSGSALVMEEEWEKLKATLTSNKWTSSEEICYYLSFCNGWLARNNEALFQADS